LVTAALLRIWCTPGSIIAQITISLRCLMIFLSLSKQITGKTLSNKARSTLSCRRDKPVIFARTCLMTWCIFCRGNNFINWLYDRPPLWSSCQSSWLQIRRPGFDSRHYKKKVVCLERGPLSLMSTTEELLDRKVAAPV
jgi:hypothetical protein